jgi:predicted DsbA family dithiol-disulfide isomerase
MLDQVAGLAHAEGLEYRWDLVSVRPNTRRAHALVALAGESGPAVQDAAAEACFRAFFTEGRDISSIDTLVAIGDGLGLDPHEVRVRLDDPAALAAVEAEEGHGRSLGITGVPFFVIDDRFAVSGARDAEDFVQVLRQIEAELAT